MNRLYTFKPDVLSIFELASGTPDSIKHIYRTPFVDNTFKIYTEINNYTSTNKTINLILKKIYPIPKQYNGDKTYYIGGGIRFGGRTPDVIINYHDIDVGNKYLNMMDINRNNHDLSMEQIINKIIQFVRINFMSDRILHFSESGHVSVQTWYDTIDKTTDCFLKKLLDCKEKTECYNKKKGKFTLTNISMLPYFIGDCREHAILSSFLLGLYVSKFKQNNIVGIMYTTAYLMDEGKKHIQYLEDHVFCVYITNNNNEIHIIDPLYSKFNTSEKKIIYDMNKIEEISKDTLNSYTFDDDINKNKIFGSNLLLHCGNLIHGTQIINKIINVPIIFNGNNQYINNFPIDSDKIYFYNKKFKIPKVVMNKMNKWHFFDIWCQ